MMVRLNVNQVQRTWVPTKLFKSYKFIFSIVLDLSVLIKEGFNISGQELVRGMITREPTQSISK